MFWTAKEGSLSFGGQRNTYTLLKSKRTQNGFPFYFLRIPYIAILNWLLLDLPLWASFLLLFLNCLKCFGFRYTTIQACGRTGKEDRGFTAFPSFVTRDERNFPFHEQLLGC